ncbi:hypothetical protein BH24ACT5_BH24ACT5_04300 [soil metagenome]
MNHPDEATSHGAVVAQLDELTPMDCPCGTTGRAFTDVEETPASVHLLEVSDVARTHHHRHQTEIYIVLDGSGVLEIDDSEVPLKPMTAVMIRPGQRHRAVGDLKLLNVVVPSFDPDDEWF